MQANLISWAIVLGRGHHTSCGFRADFRGAHARRGSRIAAFCGVHRHPKLMLGRSVPLHPLGCAHSDRVRAPSRSWACGWRASRKVDITQRTEGPAVRRSLGTRRLRRLLGCWGVLVVSSSFAAPGDVLFDDRLNGNLNQWTVGGGPGDASIGNETSNQGRSLRLRWDAVSIFTDPIAAAVPGAELSVWIRRGDDAFSEDPDDGEDLVIEYRDAGGGWIAAGHLRR